jgi:hypothetical protein
MDGNGDTTADRATVFLRRLAFALSTLWWLVAFVGPVRDGPNVDEIGHLASGLYQWQTGWRRVTYLVNPPAVRLVASFPAYVAGVRLPPDHWSEQPIARMEWALAEQLLAQEGVDRCFRWIVVGRIILAGWSFICLFALYLGLVESAGSDSSRSLAALLATTAVAFHPLYLTYAARINPDGAASGAGFVLFLGIVRWSARGPRQSALILSIASIACITTKFVWLPIIPFVLGSLLIVNRLGSASGCSHQTLWPAVRAMLLVTCSTWISLSALYRFTGVGTALGDYRFVATPENGTIVGSIGNVFYGRSMGALPVPLPVGVLMGIDQQRVDFQVPQENYFLGTWSRNGPWYYYLVGWLVKTPISTLVLTLAGLAVLAYRFGRPEWPLATPLVCSFPFAAVLVFVSYHTEMTRFMRYALPSIGCVGISIAAALQLTMKRMPTKYAVLAVAACIVLPTVWNSDRLYGYFNLAVGGSHAGHRILLDANVEWGDEFFELQQWVEEHPSYRPIHCILYDSMLARHAKVPWTVLSPYRSEPFPRGYYIVSRHALSMHGDRIGWLVEETEVEAIGLGHVVYFVDMPPELESGK